MEKTPGKKISPDYPPLLHGHINMLGHYTFTLPVRDSKNPDDVDMQQEDHDKDATRYWVLHNPPKAPKLIKFKWA
jgi:hypothetical protein